MISLIAPPDFPLITPGDDLAEFLEASLLQNDLTLEPHDVIVIAQKVVSKAENRYVDLQDISPSQAAKTLAKKVHKDPRLVELILRESRKVIRSKPGVLVVEHRLGYVHANAGIDRSNLPDRYSESGVLLLPENPDLSAEKILQALEAKREGPLAVIISDSAGRAWRIGTIGMAIGSAGMAPLIDQIGDRDLFGRKLEATIIARADELASAASMVMGEAAEATPIVIVRGAKWNPSRAGSKQLLRPPEECLFR